MKHANDLRSIWLTSAKKVFETQNQVDFHLHMISTIPSAKEVYEDRVGHYTHQDELWFWVPATQRAYDHLSSFLTGFQSNQKFGSTASLEFLQGVPDEVIQIFSRDLRDVPHKKILEGLDLPIVILRFNAGTLNSRKAQITPYLPRLIP